MQIYCKKIKYVFIYRYLMFKMREITHFLHFITDFKHFNAKNIEFYREIGDNSKFLFIFAHVINYNL